MSDKVAKAVSKMVTFYERESQVVVHDVNHFMKVWGFARTIGILEDLDPSYTGDSGAGCRGPRHCVSTVPQKIRPG